MIAYKGFRPGLICRGYQFVMGLNTTEKANCRENGFHCAEDPLDCLSYYSSLEHSEYYIVNAGGDIDEDEHDSKIACTELTVIKRLTKEELFLHGLAYMADHPRRVWSSHVAANRAMANCGYAVVRGKDPVATGRLGDILAFAKEAPDSESIVQVAVGRIDGVTLAGHVFIELGTQFFCREPVKGIFAFDNVVFHQFFQQACGTLCIAFPSFGNGGGMVFGKIPLYILQYLVIGQLLIGGRCEEYIIQITHRHPPHIHTPHPPLTARPVPFAPGFPVPCSVKQCIWGYSR